MSLIWEAFNYVNNILQFLALESNYFKVYHYIHICKFKMLSMSLIFSCRNYSNTLCGTVVVYFGFQNILWAILVIGMFSTVWWNIFEFRFMSGGIFSTGKNGVENFLSKILVSKIFHRWLSNIFHCWWIHLSKIFCRKLYVFPFCRSDFIGIFLLPTHTRLFSWGDAIWKKNCAHKNDG